MFDRRIYRCESCDFVTTCKRDYERHTRTQKHNDGGGKAITPIKAPDGYLCPCCDKLFKSRTSIYKHTPVCKTAVKPAMSSSVPTPTSAPLGVVVPSLPVSEEVTKNFMTMMMVLFQQNAELHNKMMEMCKNTGTSNSHNTNCVANSNNNNNNNNNNNTFNMNTFLNEKCKDAMNMKDFVNSIQVNMTDIENVERLGYVQGMSNIIINNLQKTDVYKRPVHCSDAKCETLLYVKDDNIWEREGPDHPKMMNAVLAVEHKNVVLVNEWAKANPRCMNSQTLENEKYMKLSRVVTDGEKDGNIAKVIKRVAKQVTVENE
jgi:uncharacterized C2H2 Zn-finger protein